ncbi:hypothetical protein [Bacillus pseudomycoides]|uniref:hypothetical protein n=1 Tax=Bacillus pseudomycoides TaxID=64104 RepID=UPI001FB46518|nr:hypothetical protein [Bacillus pseudomycoides]
MDLKSTFIRNLQEFKKFEKLLNRVFYTKRELPEQVFRKNFGNYMFEQIDLAMSDEFWDTIQILARKTQDDYILCAVLDPRPLEYYYKEFGYFNWVKLPINLTADEYLDILNIEPDSSPADSIMSNSFTITWLSPSMKWAIWGDRSYEVCVLAFKDQNNVSEILPQLKTWRFVEDGAVSDWIEMGFRGFTIPKEIADTLKNNYR